MHFTQCGCLIVKKQKFELIEKGDYRSYSAKKLIESYLEPMLNQKVDVIALGCTHYFFLTQTIQQIVGKSVLLLDTSEPVITELENQLYITLKLSCFGQIP